MRKKGYMDVCNLSFDLVVQHVVTVAILLLVAGILYLVHLLLGEGQRLFGHCHVFSYAVAFVLRHHELNEVEELFLIPDFVFVGVLGHLSEVVHHLEGVEETLVEVNHVSLLGEVASLLECLGESVLVLLDYVADVLHLLFRHPFSQE